MNKFMIMLFCLFAAHSISAQVVVKDEVIMDGSLPQDRYVTGIAYPEAIGNAVNAGAVLQGKMIYGQATGVNALVVPLSPGPDAYVPGMIVNFMATSSNTGPMTLQLNGLPPVPLKKNGSDPIDSLDLSPGQMVSVIYDGSGFQVLTKLSRKCPSGFVSINKDYCIELVEHDSVDWFGATKTCGDLNARLCTQSEWVFACGQAGTLSILNMVDNLEWVDSAGNNPDHSKAMGLDLTGVPGCFQGYTRPSIELKTFRCCYSK